MIYLLGVAVSLLVQFLKAYGKTSGWQTMALLLVVALGAAGVYTGLVAAGYWESVAAVLMTAGAFYAFILQRFEAAPSIQQG